MKKIILLLAFYCAISFVATAQNFSPSVKLSKGDKITISKISYLDEETKKLSIELGETEIEDSTVVDEIIEVIDVNETSTFLSEKIMLDATTKTFLGQLNIVEKTPPSYVYELKKDGTVMLKDETAAVEASKKQIDDVIASLLKSKESEAMLSFMQPMLEKAKEGMTPDDLKVSLLTNANFIFALNGKPMQTATPQTVKNIMISTPGAALALKADMEYRLVNYNEGKKMAVASARYIFDKSYIKTKMLAMMKTTMESMKAFGGDVPKDEDLKKMVEEEVEKDPWNLTRTYVFNLNTGMPSLISEKFVSKDKEGKEVVTILKTRITVSK